MAFVNLYDGTSVRIRPLRESDCGKGGSGVNRGDETLRSVGMRHYDETETDETPLSPHCLSGQRPRGFVTGHGGFVVVGGSGRD